MPKTSRVPFIDQTNTVNMDSRKTGKQNRSKVATSTRNTAKKAKGIESERHVLEDGKKIDENPIKKTLKSSNNKATTLISNDVSKSDNLPTGENIKLSNRISETSPAEKSLQIIITPIEKLKSKSNYDKIINKISKNNTSLKVNQNSIGKSDLCEFVDANDTLKAGLKIKKGISENKKYERQLQVRVVNVNGNSANQDSHKTITKQLKVVLPRYIPNNQDNYNQNQAVTIDPNLNKDKEQKHFRKNQKLNPQNYNPENSVQSNLKKNYPGVIHKKAKSVIIPTKQVTMNSNIQTDRQHYGLRNHPKVNPNYFDPEDSMLDITSEKSNSNKNDAGLNIKKTNSVPIYKKRIPELPQAQPQTEDLYEFTDLTPPETKKAKKKGNSSIIFDKDTHEIMKKIEQKEAKKAKKKVQTKKQPVKSYDKIVADIVSNVMQKITEKQQKNFVTFIKKIDKSNIDDAVEFINKHVPSTNRDETQELPSTSTPNGLENIAVRNPSSKLTILSDKLLTKSATVPEIDQTSIVTENLPTTNRSLNKQVPKTSITTIKKGLPTTSTPKKPENGIARKFLVSNESPLNKTSKLCDSSVNQDDINSCFGFNDDKFLSNRNSPNILEETLRSPLGFNGNKPDANSTMVGVQYNPRPSRAEGPGICQFNCKNNGLPSGSQRIFIDHTIAEAFEHTPSKTSQVQKTPAKRPAVQQSMLNYVDHSMDQNEVLQVEGSLYDIEEFKSPKKKKGRHNENVVEKKTVSTNGSPIKRKPLGDISNSPEESTFFRTGGSPRKTSKIHNVCDENAKPSRFDPNLLKVYTKRKANNQRQKEPEVENEAVAEQNSISIMTNSAEDAADVELFEDPEKVLDDMPPVEVALKKSKRKRHNNSDETDCEKKKKAKKTKLDPAAETWIEEFNDMCQNIEQYELNIE